LVTDLQTLQVTGPVRVAVKSVGRIGSAPALVTVFEDVDHDGLYGAGTDRALGSLSMPSGLTQGDSLTLEVAANGFVGFRDSPLLAMVDSDRAIDEMREDNNVASVAETCRVPPASRTFVPVLKWAWTGSSLLPQWNQVMMTPIVAPLEDTNGDGNRDAADVPSIVFQTFAGSNYNADGVLRAVSGRDGHELWSVTSAAFRTLAAGSLAVGDLDGDGNVEIVAPRSGGGLIVFDHTGAFKWQSTIPNVFWGGASLADLDGDGRPEVVVGNTVFNGNGTLRWRGTGIGAGVFGIGPLAIVADINADGRPEVISGGAAYSDVGQLLWQNTTVGEGFAAVGNFNADPYAEIVVVASGRLFLLNGAGTILWGPVALPGGGSGGAPTIGDVDADGIPEIGVAGATRYTVFRANGSVLWSAVTQDASSNVTGSTMFDFDGDDQVEVVYGDERFLRIYRGRDGTVLFQVPNTSGTTYELPVVADVDGDGHADVLVCTNQLLGAGGNGLRVYTDANNSWVPTRKIWNQHAYHITNVDDDGGIPDHETNSWEAHNTYRLNAFVGSDPTLLPDLTVSALQITSAAGGRPVSLTVRVGNAGGGPSPATTVAFYEGDPAASGVPLGTVPVAALDPGTFTDVTLVDPPNLSGGADLTAVVDPAGLVLECRETNNSVRRAVQTQSLAGDIAVATDAPAYGAGSLVGLQASITNLSGLPGAFRARLQVEDAGGVVLAAFGPRETGVLPGGAAVSLTESWPSGNSLAGPYYLRGRLFSLTDALVDEAVAPFVLRHDAGGASAVSLHTTTDRPTYHTTDRVEVKDLVSNISTNTLLTGATLRVTVLDPSGQPFSTEDVPLADLGPGALRNVVTPSILHGAAIGTYPVRGTVIDAGTGAVLAEASTSFQVVNDLRRALVGTVEVLSARLEIGQPQTCTDRLLNSGTLSLSGLEVQHVLVDVDGDMQVSATPALLDLAPGAQDVAPRTIATGGLPAGNYACLLQARIDGALVTLDFAPFTLVEPPIEIHARLALDGKGRLLVLLDRRCRHRHDDDDDHHGHDFAGGGDRDDRDHGDGYRDDCDDDPHGPSTAPGLSAQRAFLEALLRAAGWSYTITETEEDFTRQLRTGGYSVYALFSEDVKLRTSVEKELREAVFRGEGLLVAGAHDDRDHVFEDPLGVHLIGSVSTAVAADLTPGLTGLTGDVPLLDGDRALRVKRRTAARAGVYRLRANGHHRDECDDRRRSAASGSDHDESHQGDHHDDCDERLLDAVTVNDYGLGRAVFVGFDLLATAAHQADDDAGLADDLLRAALRSINPVRLETTPGAVVPVTFEVVNTGVATPARAEVRLPDGGRIVDALGGTIADGVATWSLALAEGETVRLALWIELPSGIDAVTVAAQVSAPDGNGTYLTRAEATLSVPVTPPPTAAELGAAIEDLIAGGRDVGELRRAARSLTRAAAWLPARPDQALREALQAADELLGASGEVDTLRARLGEWIRALAQEVVSGGPR
jgi:hypothetical protein